MYCQPVRYPCGPEYNQQHSEADVPSASSYYNDSKQHQLPDGKSGGFRRESVEPRGVGSVRV